MLHPRYDDIVKKQYDMLDYRGLPALCVCYSYESGLTITQQILTSGNLEFKGHFSHKLNQYDS